MRRRTDFLAAGGMHRVALLAIAVSGFLTPRIAAPQGQVRAMTGGRFSLEVDGSNVGFVRSLEGGVPVGNVTVAALGPDGITKKQISGVRYDDIVATIGIGMGKGMYDWLANSLKGGNAPRKNGRVVAADFSYKAQSEQAFNNAFISAVTFPALDGSSRDAAYFTVRITPENVAFRKGGGGDVRGAVGPKQKAWLASNFRFELGDLPTNRVASIDSFTITRKVVQTAGGAERLVTKMPAALEIPNIVVSISMADIGPWEQWRDSFLIQGNNADASEKQGAIVFLAPDMKDEMGRLSLNHCGLVRLAPDQLEANSEKVARFTVELYCEQVDFSIKEYQP